MKKLLGGLKKCARTSMHFLRKFKCISALAVVSKIAFCKISYFFCHPTMQGCRNRGAGECEGGAGGDHPPSIFWQTYTSQGDSLCPPHYYSPPPPGFSNLPTALLCCSKTNNNNATQNFNCAKAFLLSHFELNRNRILWDNLPITYLSNNWSPLKYVSFLHM